MLNAPLDLASADHPLLDDALALHCVCTVVDDRAGAVDDGVHHLTGGLASAVVGRVREGGPVVGSGVLDDGGVRLVADLRVGRVQSCLSI